MLQAARAVQVEEGLRTVVGKGLLKCILDSKWDLGT